MKAKLILTSVLFAMSMNAFSLARHIECKPVESSVPADLTATDYTEYFNANKIVAKTALDVVYIEKFKNEFAKFPAQLHRDLMRAGNKIHIMQGEGVTVDPTWDPKDVNTFDGRPWSEVPGGGGSTARGYAKSPTRVVINHLYDKQGSVHMLIHEHAHSLDSIRDLHGISNSPVWQELVTSDVNTFLSSVCGTYCTNNVEEGFAELFAHYHGCTESREQLTRELPRVAEFFKRFTSMQKLNNIWEDENPEQQTNSVQPDSTNSSGNGQILGCRRIFGRRVCI